MTVIMPAIVLLYSSESVKYPIFEVSDSKNHTLKGFRTRDVKYWVLGPCGNASGSPARVVIVVNLLAMLGGMNALSLLGTCF